MVSPRVVFVVAQQGFRDEELLQTREVLSRRGVLSVVASEAKPTAEGKFGATVTVDVTLPEVATEDFDGIIFIGGPGAQRYFEKRTALKRARQFARAGKVVAAICTAPTILANAGLLLGKRATAFPTAEATLRDRGAEYTGLPVEADGKVITAKDSTYAREFAEAIAWELGK